MKLCQARQNGTQDLRPVKSPRKAVPHHVHAAGVILRDGGFLLARRPSDGLLGRNVGVPERARDAGIPLAGWPRL